MPRKAPYGTWESPITADALIQSSTILSDVLVDPITHTIYHLDKRPAERGRTVIVDTLARRDVFGADWDAATRVQEYGGGAAVAHGGVLYFSHRPDGRVYRVSADGGVPEPVTPEGKPYRYAALAVHPTHPYLLAAVLEDHTHDTPSRVATSLALLNTRTQSVTPLASGADFYAAPCFAPDGARLAFQTWDHPDMPWQRAAVHVARVRVTVKDAALGIVWAALVPEARIAGEGGAEEAVCAPTWLDADRLLYTSDRSGYANPHLYRASARTHGPLLRAPVAADFTLPASTLGGSHCAVLGRVPGRVLFAATQDARSRLMVYEFPVEGEGEGKGGEEGGEGEGEGGRGELVPVECPFVEVACLRAVDASTVVCIAQSTKAPTAVARISLQPSTASDTPTPIPTTHAILQSSAATLAFPDGIIAQPVPLTLQRDAHAGGPLHVVVYMPTNPAYDGSSVEGERPPCVVDVHGGPTGKASMGLVWLKQYFTSRGWVWLDVNYGGSTGYGRAYVDRLNGTWGITDVRDTAHAARILAAPPHALIDAARIALRGQSAGGYTTLATLCADGGGGSLAGAGSFAAGTGSFAPGTGTGTGADVSGGTGAGGHIFAAGASLYGISDLRRLTEGTHKFESRYMEKLVGGTLEEVSQVYEERSPVSNAERIRAPLLILQGLDDRVVPPEQADIIVRKIRARGGHVEELTFAGEGHGWSRAETIKRALEAECGFYERVFGIGGA
ncbi:alpha/beta-hydrolase [Dentipellis sp. KUC8613]|nr:alpha/beta-hydrolase [Dentipellis sp. KUC8613]